MTSNQTFVDGGWHSIACYLASLLSRAQHVLAMAVLA